MNYDLALIKLKESVVLDKFGQIACLPDENDMIIQSNYLTENVSATAVGWEYSYNIFDYSYSYPFTEFHQSILNSSHPDCKNIYTYTTDLNQIICTR